MNTNDTPQSAFSTMKEMPSIEGGPDEIVPDAMLGIRRGGVVKKIIGVGVILLALGVGIFIITSKPKAPELPPSLQNVQPISSAPQNQSPTPFDVAPVAANVQVDAPTIDVPTQGSSNVSSADQTAPSPAAITSPSIPSGQLSSPVPPQPLPTPVTSIQAAQNNPLPATPATKPATFVVEEVAKPEEIVEPPKPKPVARKKATTAPKPVVKASAKESHAPSEESITTEEILIIQ
jgi:hypothetical protein